MADFSFDLESEEVNFFNGTDKEGKPVVVAHLTVHQAVYEDDVLLAELTIEAIEENKNEMEKLIAQGDHSTLEDRKNFFRKQYFRSNIYPKLAACSVGDVPTAEQAMRMPSREMNKWYAACERMNPSWFDAFKQITADKVAKLEETPQGRETLKKKGRRRRRS